MKLFKIKNVYWNLDNIKELEVKIIIEDKRSYGYGIYIDNNLIWDGFYNKKEAEDHLHILVNHMNGF